MKKTIAIAWLLLAAVLLAGGCAAATRQPVPALEPITAAPGTAAPAPEPAGSEPPAVEPADMPKPLQIECAVPDGFQPSEDESSDVIRVYRSDIAMIRCGWEEAAEETATPEGFRETILGRLPEEYEEAGFQLVSCEEAAFDSYPGFVIRWTSGANEDTVAHEAHYILTDNYIYSVEYAVSADSEDTEAAGMAAFFGSVKLTDPAS